MLQHHLNRKKSRARSHRLWPCNKK